ncbi:winged helix-turn-helix domain-containing protein [Flavobacterium sp. W21_SRS_FM6]|uniref:winged helix-turn-helix domain-containing protein n=1 Tax=Flavobacterium sp. W21_SRS_FM6 TaxID=3240268 RepID=UPI003F904572
MLDRILIVEDDADIADLIRVNLMELDVEIDHQQEGESALQAALKEHYSLILLDVMLPKINGLDICRRVRERKPAQAIIMLTAKNSELDRVLGLELGADDYMTKPFSVRELQARVRSQLRKARALEQVIEEQRSTHQSQVIDIGILHIDKLHHQVKMKAETIDLTATEFELLLHLASHPNQVFSRSQLLESVWGYHHSGYEHTVNSHINRLRAKIESDATQPVIVQTVWGIGYKFNPQGVA